MIYLFLFYFDLGNIMNLNLYVYEIILFVLLHVTLGSKYKYYDHLHFLVFRQMVSLFFCRYKQYIHHIPPIRSLLLLHFHFLLLLFQHHLICLNYIHHFLIHLKQYLLDLEPLVYYYHYIPHYIFQSYLLFLD